MQLTPAEATGHVEACLAGVACDDVLDGACQYVAVVGQAGGEGRAVIEGEGRLVALLASEVWKALILSQ